ncbi:MAG: hypothetical protein KUG82_07725 [Pseudomonadales bacterium]|nr:hypothetical protein [Pseudomonadales bacterium]
MIGLIEFPSGNKPITNNGISERTVSLLLLGLYLLCALIKMRGFWRTGRFWAEEGKVFYSQLLELPWYDAIVFQYNGHLEFSTNAIVYLSTLTPLFFAPLVTTYLSLGVQVLPIALIICYRNHLKISPIVLSIFFADYYRHASEYRNSREQH